MCVETTSSQILNMSPAPCKRTNQRATPKRLCTFCPRIVIRLNTWCNQRPLNKTVTRKTFCIVATQHHCVAVLTAVYAGATARRPGKATLTPSTNPPRVTPISTSKQGHCRPVHQTRAESVITAQRQKAEVVARRRGMARDVGPPGKAGAVAAHQRETARKAWHRWSGVA